MVKITVLTTTYRNTWYKYQLDALAKQTFKDFEWIIVDDTIDREEINPPIIHIPPKVKYPYFAKASALNDGLVRAKGELIYFINDYCIPMPNTLERHWEIQQKYQCMLSGKLHSVDCPDPPFDAMDDWRIHAFIGQGMFPYACIGDELFEALGMGYKFFYNGRNDSCPLKFLMECNGFEEEINGAWGGEDYDMAQRLVNLGLRYLLDNISLCLEIQHKSGQKPSIRSPQEHTDFTEELIKERREQKIYKANKGRDLSKEVLCNQSESA